VLGELKARMAPLFETRTRSGPQLLVGSVVTRPNSPNLATQPTRPFSADVDHESPSKQPFLSPAARARPMTAGLTRPASALRPAVEAPRASPVTPLTRAHTALSWPTGSPDVVGATNDVIRANRRAFERVARDDPAMVEASAEPYIAAIRAHGRSEPSGRAGQLRPASAQPRLAGALARGSSAVIELIDTRPKTASAPKVRMELEPKAVPTRIPAELHVREASPLYPALGAPRLTEDILHGIAFLDSAHLRYDAKATHAHAQPQPQPHAEAVAPFAAKATPLTADNWEAQLFPTHSTRGREQVVRLGQALDLLLAEQATAAAASASAARALAKLDAEEAAVAAGGGGREADAAFATAAAAAASTVAGAVGGAQQWRCAEVRVHELIVAELVRQERVVCKDRAALLERSAGRWLALAASAEPELRHRALQLARMAAAKAKLSADNERLSAAVEPALRRAQELESVLVAERARRATAERRCGELEALLARSQTSAGETAALLDDARKALAQLQREAEAARLALDAARAREEEEAAAAARAAAQLRAAEHALGEESEARLALAETLERMRALKLEAEAAAHRAEARADGLGEQLERAREQLAAALRRLDASDALLAETRAARDAAADEAARLRTVLARAEKLLQLSVAEAQAAQAELQHARLAARAREAELRALGARAAELQAQLGLATERLSAFARAAEGTALGDEFDGMPYGELIARARALRDELAAARAALDAAERSAAAMARRAELAEARADELADALAAADGSAAELREALLGARAAQLAAEIDAAEARRALEASRRALAHAEASLGALEARGAHLETALRAGERGADADAALADALERARQLALELDAARRARDAALAEALERSARDAADAAAADAASAAAAAAAARAALEQPRAESGDARLRLRDGAAAAAEVDALRAAAERLTATVEDLHDQLQTQRANAAVRAARETMVLRSYARDCGTRFAARLRARLPAFAPPLPSAAEASAAALDRRLFLRAELARAVRAERADAPARDELALAEVPDGEQLRMGEAYDMLDSLSNHLARLAQLQRDAEGDGGAAGKWAACAAERARRRQQRDGLLAATIALVEAALERDALALEAGGYSSGSDDESGGEARARATAREVLPRKWQTALVDDDAHRFRCVARSRPRLAPRARPRAPSHPILRSPIRSRARIPPGASFRRAGARARRPWTTPCARSCSPRGASLTRSPPSWRAAASSCSRRTRPRMQSRPRGPG
jgi:hypothetical protein